MARLLRGVPGSVICPTLRAEPVKSRMGAGVMPPVRQSGALVCGTAVLTLGAVGGSPHLPLSSFGEDQIAIKEKMLCLLWLPPRLRPV